MSLRTNIESFQTHLLNDLDYHFDIFRFNETKITTSIELALDPKIPGYDFQVPDHSFEHRREVG